MSIKKDRRTVSIAFEIPLYLRVKKAAQSDMRSISSWIANAASLFLSQGVAHPQKRSPKSRAA